MHLISVKKVYVFIPPQISGKKKLTFGGGLYKMISDMEEE